jgi:hypothetical protein
MPEITKITSGSLAKSNKLNEVINIVNSIGFNLTVRAGINDETPQLIVSDNNAELIVSAGSGSGGGGNIDVIWCVNGEPYSGTVVGEIGDPI